MQDDLKMYNNFWNALIGGVFLEGGFELVLEIFGKIYDPFF